MLWPLLDATVDATAVVDAPMEDATADANVLEPLLTVARIESEVIASFGVISTFTSPIPASMVTDAI